MEEKLKNIPVKEAIHKRIVQEAEIRGMTIQGLSERVLIGWLNDKKKKILGDSKKHGWKIVNG